MDNETEQLLALSNGNIHENSNLLIGNGSLENFQRNPKNLNGKLDNFASRNKNIHSGSGRSPTFGTIGTSPTETNMTPFQIYQVLYHAFFCFVFAFKSKI